MALIASAEGGADRTGNRLLARLGAETRRRLMDAARPLRLHPGDMLAREGRDIEEIVFPETAPVMIAIRSGGSSQDIGLVGCDGVIGWSRLLDREPSCFDATVMFQPGDAICVPIDAVARAATRDRMLHDAVLGFAQRFTLQMARTLCSSMRDTPLRRVARLLLMLDDRLSVEAMPITHAAVAATLNLRRATVTDCLHILEGEHFVRCTRGRITVRGRAGLERLAGDAYGPNDGLAAG